MHGDVHDVVPEEVQARFDIVGFDPRGVGESTPVRCFDNSDEQQAFFGARPAFPVSPEEIDQAIAAAHELADRCRASSTASCSITSARPTWLATSTCCGRRSATTSSPSLGTPTAG